MSRQTVLSHVYLHLIIALIAQLVSLQHVAIELSLAQIATPWDSSTSWCYKTYRYGSAVSQTGTCCAHNCGKAAPSAGLITLHVSQNLFEGSTGCREWEAGFLLSEFVLSHADLFKGVLALSLLLT